MNPKFILTDWMSEFTESDFFPNEKDSNSVETELIVGPHDLCKILCCRSLLEEQMSLGDAEHIDYFIWAQGEGSVVGATRMGGRPDLPGIEHWPQGVDGNFLPFIGQINFSDSRDLVNVPENLVLIFAQLINGCVEEHKLLWFSPDEVSRVDPSSIPATVFEISPHHGYHCRIATYPDGSPLVAPEDHYLRIRGMKVYRPGNIFRPSGTCIGGYNFEERVLAIVNWLRPTPDVIYPYVNRRDPYLFQDWVKARDEREELVRLQPSTFTEVNSVRIEMVREHPSALFEFADCGSMVIVQTDNGSFDLQTSSF